MRFVYGQGETVDGCAPPVTPKSTSNRTTGSLRAAATVSAYPPTDHVGIGLGQR